MSRIYLEVISVLESTSKSQLGVPKLNFQFLEDQIFEFSSQTHFLSPKSDLPVEYVHMDHTDHLGVQYLFDFDL